VATRKTTLKLLQPHQQVVPLWATLARLCHQQVVTWVLQQALRWVAILWALLLQLTLLPLLLMPAQCLAQMFLQLQAWTLQQLLQLQKLQLLLKKKTQPRLRVDPACLQLAACPLSLKRLTKDRLKGRFFVYPAPALQG
jgi:hypothetical protein